MTRVIKKFQDESQELAFNIQRTLTDVWCLDDPDILQTTIPRDSVRACPRVAYGIDRRKEEQSYRVLYNNRTSHYAVLMVLAEASRMEAVLFQDSIYEDELLSLMKSRDCGDDEWKKPFLDLALHGIQKGVARFFLKGLLQTGLQASMQISIMALYRHVTGVIDLQMLFSVVVTMLGILTDFPDAYEIVKKVLKVLFTDIPCEQIEQIKRNRDWRLHVECKKMRQSIWWRAVRFGLYILIYAGVYLWSAVKLLSYFACKSSLYNVGQGCVTFQSD